MSMYSRILYLFMEFFKSLKSKNHHVKILPSRIRNVEILLIDGEFLFKTNIRQHGSAFNKTVFAPDPGCLRDMDING